MLHLLSYSKFYYLQRSTRAENYNISRKAKRLYKLSQKSCISQTKRAIQVIKVEKVINSYISYAGHVSQAKKAVQMMKIKEIMKSKKIKKIKSKLRGSRL